MGIQRVDREARERFPSRSRPLAVAAMLRPMTRLLPLLLLLFSPVRAADGPWVIDAEFWAAPRSGEAVLAEPALRAAVDTLMFREESSRLVIRHPGGETGQLWAEELRGWLVSLGIPSVRIQTEPGGVRDDQLQLTVEP